MQHHEVPDTDRSIDSIQNDLDSVFYKDRKRAKKCGKIVMYVGYILLVVNVIAAILGVLGLFGLKMDPNRGPRGKKH